MCARLCVKLLYASFEVVVLGSYVPSSYIPRFLKVTPKGRKNCVAFAHSMGP